METNIIIKSAKRSILSCKLVHAILHVQIMNANTPTTDVDDGSRRNLTDDGMIIKNVRRAETTSC